MAEVFPLIITLSVVVLLFLWSRIRHVADFFSRNPILRDAAYRLSEVRLPTGWRHAADLNDGAGIQAVDPLRQRYGLVFSEWRENFAPEMTLERYSADTRDTLASSVLVLAVTGPERRSVGGFAALQYEIEAVTAMTEIKYLHTAVAGRRAFHQLLTWAPRRCYDRTAFEQLLDGFRETPGSSTFEPCQSAPSARRRIGFVGRE